MQWLVSGVFLIPRHRFLHCCYIKLAGMKVFPKYSQWRMVLHVQRAVLRLTIAEEFSEPFLFRCPMVRCEFDCYCRILTGILVVYSKEIHEVVVSSEPQDAPPVLKEREVSGPYCGIYALLACFDLFDIRPRVETLLVPDYVGSFKGSNNIELVAAAEKYGLYGKTYSNLTDRELKRSRNPMILHFRASSSDSEYNHWVAYLGTDGQLARIIDYPHEMATIPFAELMAKWDGTAIEISREPVSENIASGIRLRYIMTAGILLVCCFVIQSILKRADLADWFLLTRYDRCKSAFPQTAGLVLFLAFFGIGYHAIAEIGFLKNPSAVAEVTRRFYSVDIPEIPLAEMERVIAEEPETRIYDARYRSSYEKGTILRAVSMPINSNLEERERLLSGVEKNSRIIVFCQSSECGYADEVAQFLKFNGYRNTVIYRGGWREWKQKKERIEKIPNSD